MKLITISNLSFTDTTFVRDRSLISTEGIELFEDIFISLSNIEFSDISFKSKGVLLDMKHQLPRAVTIYNSVFKNLKACQIMVESSNKQNAKLTTQVHINSSSFDSINGEYSLLILVNQGGRLEISNSTFSNIVSFEEGAVIKGGLKKTKTIIRTSQFINNTALQGGVFSVEEGSAISLYDSNITHNFASVSGVIRVVTNGYFEFYNARIYDNYASQSPISEIFDSSSISVVSGCEIYNNEALSLMQITAEFNACGKLWFIPKSFILFTSPGLPVTASEQYFGETSHSLFQLISGTQNPTLSGSEEAEILSSQSTLRIENGTSIYNQSSLLYLFLASTSIKDSTIHRLSLIEHPIIAASSSLFLQNVTFADIESSRDLYLIFTLQDSTLISQYCLFIQIQASALYSRSTQIILNGSEIKQVTGSQTLIHMSSCDSVNLIGIIIESSSSNGAPVVTIEESRDVSVVNVSASFINESLIYILSSSVTLIKSLFIRQ